MNNTTSYMEWSAVIAGAVLACAITLVLVQFGGGIGLSAMDVARYEGDNRIWRVIMVGLWLLWTQLMSSMAGGYLAGRMRAPMENAASHESEIRDGAHGLMVWAASTVAVAIALGLMSALAALAAQAGVDAPASPAAAAVPADFARRSGIIFGFVAAASSLVSAVAAWWMGTVGGAHRDATPDVSRHISFRRVVVKRS